MKLLLLKKGRKENRKTLHTAQGEVAEESTTSFDGGNSLLNKRQRISKDERVLNNSHASSAVDSVSGHRKRLHFSKLLDMDYQNKMQWTVMMKKVSLLTYVMLITACSWSSFSKASREKRYVFTNIHAPVTLGFILRIPISMAIPVFGHKNERSLSVQNIICEDEETPGAMYWDAAYSPQLQKLTLYFAFLELFSMGCQERLICELATEPETFSPIAEVFLKELRPLYGPVQRSPDALMWRYTIAMKEGFTAPIEACGRSYPKCPLTAKRIINMPLLKVWQFLASKFNIQLV